MYQFRFLIVSDIESHNFPSSVNEPFFSNLLFILLTRDI